ncbi:7-deoxyloganetin glucosyltransferase-like isoform X1 [Lolium rigidum]|uniref:7-deoxyloganetin glucosyltransferase-like isoform X1 n=1 Tax=Lolium rigidum TaxID=89674 RepID=UPI001F5C0E34|nr:7-deoxyloganetin glucosyltransferase-like isoform X1 [Lolium rigidum]
MGGNRNTVADEKPHAVCVPFPAQGHITPMMKLAKVLHSKGFHVTFVNTEYNHRRLIRSRGSGAVAGLSGFRFATIPDGLPPSDADATQDQEALCYSTMTTCLPHLKKLLGGLNNSADGVPPVTCLVADSIMSFSLDAAAELGVPCALFFAASACGYMGYHSLPFLIDEGLVPLKGIISLRQNKEQVTNGYLDTPVPQALGMSKHMRLRDFPSFVRTTDRGDIMIEFVLHEHQQARRAAAFIVNTFDELEEHALDAIRATLPGPVYTIGPLSLLAEQLVLDDGKLAMIRPSLWREDHSCLEWLQGREPRSVVYVNFGSITTMSSQDLVEFAWGLASCGYDFLWIIRNDLVKGDAVVLPPEFLEATEGRRLLASWCEQEAVLRHEAVGVFLTHCGWNSTLEGLNAGVPMLCWPFFAEQQTNTRYVCMEWGVGMEVGDDVRREVVGDRIREVMGGGDMGREMRRKAAEWSEIAARATTQPGGRSLANLESLLKDVLLMGRLPASNKA